jgi:multidrug efflux pump
VVDGILVDDKVREISAWLGEQKFDPAIDLAFKGQDEEQRMAQDFLGKAFAVALFIMAIILVTQFNSFYRAFLILSAVVMSTIGVMIGLLVTGQPFGIVMTGVGVIALAGIVVNNNIVLIDTYAHLLRQGYNAYDAVVLTGAQRLRPVLLTTVTTITGLLPMMFQLNIDFVARSVTQGAPSTQWWVQLSTAVVYGLGFATLLTLVVTPCMLALGHRADQAFGRLLARVRPGPRNPAVPGTA